MYFKLSLSILIKAHIKEQAYHEIEVDNDIDSSENWTRFY